MEENCSVNTCGEKMKDSIDWKPISSNPAQGRFFVKGGRYNTAYSQIHGFLHDAQTLIEYHVQINPDVDPPYLVVDKDEPGLGISNPTHWCTESEFLDG